MGLSAYILPNSGLNALERGTSYLFCGTRSDTVKGICFEGIVILAFEDGNVVQRGNHGELAAQEKLSTINSKHRLTIITFRCKLTGGKWLTI